MLFRFKATHEFTSWVHPLYSAPAWVLVIPASPPASRTLYNPNLPSLSLSLFGNNGESDVWRAWQVCVTPLSSSSSYSPFPSLSLSPPSSRLPSILVTFLRCTYFTEGNHSSELKVTNRCINLLSAFESPFVCLFNCTIVSVIYFLIFPSVSMPSSL